jgi:hypothetical protein
VNFPIAAPGFFVLSLLCACAHSSPLVTETGPGLKPGSATMSIAPETVGTDPSLREHGAELRAALAKALAAEGFRVVERPEKGALLVTTSIDYSPWTSVSASLLYVVVGLQSEGLAVDQVDVQRINEAFPEPVRVDDLAHAVAKALATSPRLKEFLAK